MKVADLMSTDLITVEPRQDLGIALALMYEFDVRSLPVVELDTGNLVGIVALADVRLAIDSPFLEVDEQQVISDLESILVAEAMSTDLVVVGPNATIAEAARRMLSHKVNGLPVVQLGSEGNAFLVGMITTSDLLRHLVELEGERKAEG